MKPLFEILQEIRPEYDFSASTDFIADGMLDSFDVVALVAALEKKFSVTIPGTQVLPENFQNFLTIKSLLKNCGAKI